MRAASVSFPGNELLAEYARSHHGELQEIPIWLEPKKQVCAEHDGERTEPEYPIVAPRPTNQHIQGVDENNLRDDQRDLVINLAPIPSPVRVNAGMHRELHVVNGFGDEFIMQFASSSNDLTSQEKQKNDQ